MGLASGRTYDVDLSAGSLGHVLVRRFQVFRVSCVVETGIYVTCVVVRPCVRHTHQAVTGVLGSLTVGLRLDVWLFGSRSYGTLVSNSAGPAAIRQ